MNFKLKAIEIGIKVHQAIHALRLDEIAAFVIAGIL
jgi:hypothetical protein